MSDQKNQDLENEDESDDLTAETAPEGTTAQAADEKKEAAPAHPVGRSTVLQGGVHN
jgi:hypothetical protein